MRYRFPLAFAAVLLFAFAALSQTKRYMAVTIDDLPVVSTRNDLKNRRDITKKILAHLKKSNAPAIGFVNENKLYKNAGSDKRERDERQIDLLRQWADAGLELGNHTFWHSSLNRIPLEKFQGEIMLGEIVTKELMAARGKQVRYLRHPYLNTGLSMEVKDGLNKFLAEHKYTIAPVTLDNSDWAFSRAYDVSFDNKDKKLMKRVGEAYLAYMATKTDYWERQSVRLFGREVKQTLLIHANFINSAYLDDLLKMYTARGYKFITLDEALTDEAYRLPDNFIRNNGISWLHRWALDKGRENVLPDEPKVPDWVMKTAGLESE